MNNEEQFSFDQILTSSMRASAYSVQKKTPFEIQKKISNVIKSPDDSEINLKLSNLKDHSFGKDFRDNFIMEQSEIYKQFQKVSGRTYEEHSLRKTLQSEFEKLEGEFRFVAESNSVQINHLKEINDAWQKISNSTKIADFEKQFEVFYRPFFWHTVISNPQFREIIYLIKIEVLEFQKEQKTYEMDKIKNKKYCNRLKENLGMIETEIEANLSEKFEMECETKTNLEKIEYLSDQKSPSFNLDPIYREINLINSEKKRIRQELREIKQNLGYLELDLTTLNNNHNLIDKNVFCQLLIQFENEFEDLYFMKIENQIKNCEFFKNKHQKQEEIINGFFTIYKSQIADEIDILLSKKDDLNNKLISKFNKMVSGFLISYFSNFKKSIEVSIISLKNRFDKVIEAKMNFKRQSFKVLINQNLKQALKFMKRNESIENRRKHLEIREVELNESRDLLKKTLEDMFQTESCIGQLVHLKQREELILSKVDEVNKNFMIFCLNDLIQINSNFQLIIFILLARRLNPVDILVRYQVLEELVECLKKQKTNSIVEIKPLKKTLTKFHRKLVNFSYHFYYSNLYTQCPDLKHLLSNIDTVDFVELQVILSELFKSIGSVMSHELVLLDPNISQNNNLLDKKSDQINIKKFNTIFNKNYQLTCQKSSEIISQLFETIQPFLNGFKAFFRLSITEKTKNQNLQNRILAKTETKNINLDKNQRKDFNPFLKNQKPPHGCGYKSCYVFFSLETDEIQFIVKGKGERIDLLQKDTFVKWSLPISHFKYPLMPNNTKDFIDKIGKTAKSEIDKEEQLFEVCLANVKFERVDLILAGLPLFCCVFSFLENLAKNKKAYEELKKKIVLKI